MGGEMTEIDRFIGPLKEHAGKRELMGNNDPADRQRWATPWRELGEHVERLAEDDARKGLRASAARKYLRAANYGFVAEVNAPAGAPATEAIYADAQRRFRRGCELGRTGIQFVDVPFEGTVLPSLFVPAQGADGPAPCMVHFDGSHDVKEVSWLRHRNGLAERGISMLIVDHPGSGEALRRHKLYARPDIEVAATAAVDYLEGRDDVDADKIGILAQSMGGYYAPRSAAFEKRLKVCVVWGAIWDIHQLGVDKGMTFSPEEFALYGLDSAEAIGERIKDFTLEGGIMEQVECPLLVFHGENDRQCPLWTAERTYERAVNAASRELRVFNLDEGGAEHCELDIVSMATDFIHDWLALFWGTDSVPD
ncbi:MAG: alpha/beta hydrolase, partial [Actinobacteria bacterium]|nr:alpha/beta hydrolase [Actinomycetota bacterium]